MKARGQVSCDKHFVYLLMNWLQLRRDYDWTVARLQCVEWHWQSRAAVELQSRRSGVADVTSSLQAVQQPRAYLDRVDRGVGRVVRGA